MSLLSEYRSRHNAQFISINEDGVLFCNKNNKQELIILTSCLGRSTTTCYSCSSKDNTSNIIIEIYNKNGLLDHLHELPDGDLYKYIKLHEGVEPFEGKKSDFIENWLWSFFIHSNMIDLNSLKFKNYKDQILSINKDYPDLVGMFYENYFCKFLLGRKYLLG